MYINVQSHDINRKQGMETILASTKKEIFKESVILSHNSILFDNVKKKALFHNMNEKWKYTKEVRS